uniref:asparagine synthase (glutamine-hydrolyzing) n=1 Tax=viral metagenome TaxID=1070528 RepID=A0A6C0L1E7_9ZZZZ|tara:strand:- start:6157 stop:7701 length:1545 start_codon:yes stop_codon:yes gene_type:complete
MCGIFCYFSDKGSFDYSLSKNGMKCSHRGPDNTQELIIHGENNSMIYFMFHRLAINGLDEKSNQPLKIKRFPHLTLICNGEIYNYKELAQKYNFSFETKSDCEVILHLATILPINKYIQELDGVFSFIIYDQIQQCIMVGRDPYGIRPLYFFNDEGKYGFSSEMKCLTEMSNNVKFYPPGGFSVYYAKTKQYHEYTYNDYEYNEIDDSDENICNSIHEKLNNAVHKRLITDRPFGCLLSGGLDSSIITSIICKYFEPKNIRTFAIGLENSPDLIAAQKVADYLGTNHTNVIVSEKEMLEAIDETIYQIESKDTTTVRASVPMLLLSKYIRDNTDIKVIFSGEGSDEASGSYLYFHNAPNPTEFQKESIRLVRDVQYFDVLRSDRTTAGAGLEIRVPFFDKEFMRYYMSIDPRKKVVRDGMEKYLLRKSFETELPEEIVWRRKDGFSDGVSKKEKPWYEIINDYTMEKYKLPEKEYYLSVYQKYYNGFENVVPYYWMPKWIENVGDNPSGRLIID